VIGQITAGAEGRKAPVGAPSPVVNGQTAASTAPAVAAPLSPAVRVMVEEHGISPGELQLQAEVASHQVMCSNTLKHARSSASTPTAPARPQPPPAPVRQLRVPRCGEC
jgi:hypothetical protein